MRWHKTLRVLCYIGVSDKTKHKDRAGKFTDQVLAKLTDIKKSAASQIGNKVRKSEKSLYVHKRGRTQC